MSTWLRLPGSAWIQKTAAGKYGMLRAIERGYVQRRFRTPRMGISGRWRRRRRLLLGVNEFAIEQEVAVPIQRIDEALEGRQVERVRALRGRRGCGCLCGGIEAGGGHGAEWGEFDAAYLNAVESYATVERLRM